MERIIIPVVVYAEDGEMLSSIHHVSQGHHEEDEDVHIDDSTFSEQDEGEDCWYDVVAYRIFCNTN